MKVTTEDINGYTEIKKTPHRGGTNYPRWNDNLVFSKRTWKKITVRIYDYDGAGREPDSLCETREFDLESFNVPESYNCHPSGTAYVVIGYAG